MRGLAVVAVVLVVVLALSIFLAGRPPDLTVAEGRQVGFIRGNLTAVNSGLPRQDSFTATTYANQSGRPSSVLILTVNAVTWFSPNLADPYQGTIITEVTATVTAQFALDIHPARLVLAYNGTGPGVHVDAQTSALGGTNVSIDGPRDFGFVTNGSAAFTATPVNQGGPGPVYIFRLGCEFRIAADGDYLPGRTYDEGFYGFRATVSGFLLPNIPVEVVMGLVAVT